MVVPLPDDFVHAGVGEERLIKFIVAPLPVAQQVHYHIPAELALVLDCQPRGTDNFFRIIPVYVDNCTSNDFTCPGMQNIVTAITPNPFQSNGNRYNVCVEHLTKRNLQNMLFVMTAGIRSLPRRCNWLNLLYSSQFQHKLFTSTKLPLDFLHKVLNSS